MKLVSNKLAMSLLILGLIGSAQAAGTSNMGSESGLKGVFFGGDALDVQPRNGDLDFVTVFPRDSNGDFTTKAITQHYNLQMRLFGGIRFGDGDDLTLSWITFHSKNYSSIADPTGTDPDGHGLSQPRWLFADDWFNINGHVKFDLNEVALVMGHTVRFNNPWSIRYAAGLDYANLDSNMLVEAEFDIVPDTKFGYDNTNKLKGIGPRVEFDMRYDLPYGFALFANTNAALLVSERKMGLDTLQVNAIKFVCPTLEFSNRHVIVPKMGVRAGVSYTYVFGQAGDKGANSTALTFEGGWLGETYIHAIERVANDEDSGSFFARTQSSYFGVTTKTSNFAYQGLFLGINVNMNWL